MYTILEETELLTFDEIKAKYKGKWVFMTNCEFSEGHSVVRAIPRVIADRQLEGLEEGIYDVYDNVELYGNTTDFSFYNKSCLIKSISFVGGNTNATSNVSV